MFALLILMHAFAHPARASTTIETLRIESEGHEPIELHARELTPEQELAWGHLDGSQKTEFYARRAKIITMTARTLQSPLLVGSFGRAIFIKEKLFHPRKSRGHEFNALYASSLRALLEAMDGEFFANPSAVTGLNEVGVLLSAGVVGGAKIAKVGAYRTHSVGMVLGYNFEHDQSVVEIFTDGERMTMGMPGAVQVGVTGRALLYVASRTTEQAVAPLMSGKSFTFPASPFYTMRLPNRIHVGGSMAFAFPPFMDFFYGFLSDIHRRTFFSYHKPVPLLRKIRSELWGSCGAFLEGLASVEMSPDFYY